MKTILLLLIAALGAHAQKPNIVFVGDSFTYGYIAGGGQQVNTYPLLTLSVTNPSQYDAVVHNLGVVGRSIGPKSDANSMLAHAAADVDTLIVAGKKNIVILEGGLIDISGGIRSDTNVYNDILQYASERKVAGWDVVMVSTIVAGQYGANNGLACYTSAYRQGTVWTNSSVTGSFFGPSTSSTSTTIPATATGSKTFTLDQTLLGYDTTGVGSLLKVSSRANPANFMQGRATTYTGTTLTINLAGTTGAIGGSGTFTDWTVNILCECPGGSPACGINATSGVNAMLRASKGTADVLVDFDASADFYNPYNFTWRQSDGHWLVVLNGSAATLVGRKINTQTRRIFPMGSAIVNGN